MWKVLLRARGCFARDQRANVGVLFAFSAVPLIGLLGGAVDVARHHRYKTELMNTMDAATLALVRSGIKEDGQADTFINNYITASRGNELADGMLHLASFNATQIQGGWRVTSNGYMDAAFLPVVGIRRMPLDLASEVMMSGGNYEIALALDNTGSMGSFGRIEALRDAAGDLVDDLYREPGADNRVKMSLVPFVTAVNIRTPGVFQWDWIDPAGADPSYSFNFERPVNRLDLFDEMHVAWRGCVEARVAPHDLDDTEPTSAATRYVPYLWPDEPSGRGYGNDYIDQRGASGSELDLLRDVDKYAVPSRVRVADTASAGPNASCPRPIVELTNDTRRMHDEIDRMRPYNSSGTNVAQGLLWGWNVLSPDEPYSQGVPYSDDDTTKVLVLLSDGRNQVVQHNPERRATRSDYTGYGYLAAGRMGSTTSYRVAEQNIDAKVRTICENVKNTGIRVYTILFQVDFAETQDIFRDCASRGDDGQPLFYYVPDASQLQAAFEDIGQDLTSVRVAR